jgi:hypothetical protein
MLPGKNIISQVSISVFHQKSLKSTIGFQILYSFPIWKNNYGHRGQKQDLMHNVFMHK